MYIINAHTHNSNWNDFPRHHIDLYFFTLILCTTSESLENRFEVNCLSKTKIWVHIHRLVVTFSFFWKIFIKIMKKSNPTFFLNLHLFFLLYIQNNKSTISYIHVNIQNMKKCGIFLIEKQILGILRFFLLKIHYNVAITIHFVFIVFNILFLSLKYYLKISGIQHSRVLEYSEDISPFWRNLWPETIWLIIPLIICWKTKLIPNYVWSDLMTK